VLIVVASFQHEVEGISSFATMSHMHIISQLNTRQPFTKLAPRLRTHLSAIDIGYRAIPAVDLGLDPPEVSTNTFRPPLVTVTNATAALHKPIPACSPHSVESSKDGFEMLAR
jgi:hypothetical protein